MSKKWAYLVVYIKNQSPLEARLNELGENGWELVLVMEESYVFKRAYEDEPAMLESTVGVELRTQ